MTDTITLERLTGLIRSEWENWERVLALVPRERMSQPGVTGYWSVKDLIAHVTWFERDILSLLRERSMANASALWNLPTDERNQAIYDENRTRSLSEVMDEAQRVHAGVMQALAGLLESDLHDPRAFEGMLPDWVPWQILRENTSDHYADHAGQIAGWLEPKP